jgi:hypothetical protein
MVGSGFMSHQIMAMSFTDSVYYFMNNFVLSISALIDIFIFLQSEQCDPWEYAFWIQQSIDLSDSWLQSFASTFLFRFLCGLLMFFKTLLVFLTLCRCLNFKILKF